MESKVQELADKIMAELQAAGMTPEQMLEVISMTREKFRDRCEHDLRFVGAGLFECAKCDFQTGMP